VWSIYILPHTSCVINLHPTTYIMCDQSTYYYMYHVWSIYILPHTSCVINLHPTTYIMCDQSTSYHIHHVWSIYILLHTLCVININPYRMFPPACTRVQSAAVNGRKVSQVQYPEHPQVGEAHRCVHACYYRATRVVMILLLWWWWSMVGLYLSAGSHLLQQARPPSILQAERVRCLSERGDPSREHHRLHHGLIESDGRMLMDWSIDWKWWKASFNMFRFQLMIFVITNAAVRFIICTLFIVTNGWNDKI